MGKKILSDIETEWRKQSKNCRNWKRDQARLEATLAKLEKEKRELEENYLDKEHSLLWIEHRNVISRQTTLTESLKTMKGQFNDLSEKQKRYATCNKCAAPTLTGMPRLPDTVECLASPDYSAGFENPILEFNRRIQALEDELTRKMAIDIGRNRKLMMELRIAFKSLFIKFQRDCSGKCLSFMSFEAFLLKIRANLIRKHKLIFEIITIKKRIAYYAA